MTVVRKVLRGFWPEIDDEKSSVSAAMSGVAGTGILVVVNLACGLALWLRRDSVPYDPIFLEMSGVFAVLGVGIWLRSRLVALISLGASIVFCLFLIDSVPRLYPFGLAAFVVVSMVACVLQVSGVRGTFKYAIFRKK